MAERTALSNKLKLAVSYQTDDGTQKKRQVTMAHLKAGAEPANIVDVVTARGTLQDDTFTAIREVVENEISA